MTINVIIVSLFTFKITQALYLFIDYTNTNPINITLAIQI